MENVKDWPEELLQKLQCVSCLSTDLTGDGSGLTCRQCRQIYPWRYDRFPDFLTEAQRSALQSEIEFWHSHYGHTVYESESDISYQSWAELIRADSRDQVIELGCGSGAQLRRLQAGLLVGLEPVASLMAATSGFWGVVGTMEKIPFRDASFDLVYFNYSLHHVSNRALAIAEAARILRPGGRLLAIEPNGWHPHRWLTSSPRSPFRRTRLLVGFIDPHESFFPPEEIISLGQGLGLTVEALEYREAHYTKPTRRYRLQQLFSRLGRHVIPRRFIYPSFFLALRKTVNLASWK